MAFLGFSIRLFGYFLYGVVLTAVLLYVRFPTEKFLAYCENNLATTFPGSQWNLSGGSYTPPFTGTIGEARVTGSDPENGGLVFRQVKISIPSIFAPRSWHIQTMGYGGEMEGQLVWLPDGRFKLTNVDLHGVDIAALAADVNLDNREVAGTLTITGEYSGERRQPLKGEGSGKVTLASGRVSLAQQILSLEMIQFDSIAADFIYQDGVVQLAQGNVQGQQIYGEFSGDVAQSWPVSEAMLTLNGKIGVSETFLEARPNEKRLIGQMLKRFGGTTLPFYLGGSVGSPTFGFGK